MSIAARADCAASMLFVVLTLLRCAAYMTVMRTTITTASTVSVIISSTSVNPRRSLARGEVRMNRASRLVMTLPPHVRGGRHGTRTGIGPRHRHGDLLQVLQGVSHLLNVVEALPGSVVAECLGGGSTRMAAQREIGVVPSQRPQLLDLLLRIEIRGRLHLAARLAPGSRREQLADRENPEREHDERDHQLDHGRAAFGMSVRVTFGMHRDLLASQHQAGQLDADRVLVAA